MFLLLIFAFLSGLVTILAPCIWPLLPIILSGSIAGKGRARPLGITLGIMLSFSVFTLAVSSLVRIFHIDPNIFRLVAVIVIGFLGVAMLLPDFSAFLETLVSRLTAVFGPAKAPTGSGFTPGFLTGLSLGIVWSPCAGPILAAIATLAATGQVTSAVVAVTASYVTGVGVPLFIFAYGGQQLITKTRFISAHLPRIQQVFGVVMILTALAIYTNYDQLLQAKLLDVFPQFSTTLNSFESNPAVKSQLDVLKGVTPAIPPSSVPAPDFVGITKWLNLPAGQSSLSLADLKGKVVLVDFWTYTCINCIRTLPHVTAWYDKYNHQGFVVIGVHTPEFEFEKDTSNVEAAIKQFNIHYPVAQDNNYSTWNAYQNQYWPAEYLIDATGTIRHTNFGEGEYDQTEQMIQSLLQQAGHPAGAGLIHMPDLTPGAAISPETYIGSNRAQYYYPDGALSPGAQTFTLAVPPLNSFSLGGQWNIAGEDAVTGAAAVLNYQFNAAKVYLVLNPATSGTSTIKVFLDGKQTQEITVDSDRLYTLVDLGSSPGKHLLRLEFTSGIGVFAFTFG